MTRYIIRPVGSVGKGSFAWADTENRAKLMRQQLERVTGLKWKIKMEMT